MKRFLEATQNACRYPVTCIFDEDPDKRDATLLVATAAARSDSDGLCTTLERPTKASAGTHDLQFSAETGSSCRNVLSGYTNPKAEGLII